jgi:hypothetical protein
MALVHWNLSWYGPDVCGTYRANVERQVERVPQDEWVYKAAEVDHSKVIWAGEMDPASNRELFQSYEDRKVWLVQPVTVSPYPLSGEVTPGSG